MYKNLNIEEALKEPKTEKVFRYFRKKWRYLDSHILESCFNFAIIKAVRIHNEDERSFGTTLSQCINWEIRRSKPKSQLKFYSSDFEFLQKREIAIADETNLLYNLVTTWMEKYLEAETSQIIKLRIFQNSTWSEVAEAVKCHERSAKSKFSIGLSQLRYIAKSEGIKLCDELDLA